MLAEKASP